MQIHRTKLSVEQKTLVSRKPKRVREAQNSVQRQVRRLGMSKGRIAERVADSEIDPTKWPWIWQKLVEPRGSSIRSI